MIKVEKIVVFGFEAAIRGMRNPMNSWDKSDSFICDEKHCNDFCIHKNLNSNICSNANLPDGFQVGNNDLKLMQSLIKAGTDHSKFMRMISVTMDVTAPMYFNKELDTYKIGTVRNSCSTMHKIHDKEFTLDDFSHEHLIGGIEIIDDKDNDMEYYENPTTCLEYSISILNFYRKKYLETKDKKYWWQMIQLLPSSYNQKFTWQANYQVLRNIYFSRKNHKLDEWVEFCNTVKQLPYAKELICLE